MVPQEDAINVDQAKRKANVKKNITEGQSDDIESNAELNDSKLAVVNKLPTHDIASADNKWEVT